MMYLPTILLIGYLYLHCTFDICTHYILKNEQVINYIMNNNNQYY